MNAAKKQNQIRPLGPIRPISIRHDVGTSFGDAEFFRACMKERALILLPRKNVQDVKEDLEYLAKRICVRVLSDDPKDHRKFWADQTEILIQIAALCERAAVDLTIPASRKSPISNHQLSIINKSPSRKAAVDLTIPASRIQRQDAKPPRRKKGARK